MSVSLAINNVDASIIDVPVAKAKNTSTLPAKHFKNLSFGYWIIMKMKNDSFITD